MSAATGILAFIATLLVMIVFHEFGHFVAARRFGIKVEEFFVGFGPRLFARRRGETTYGIKAILLGGYVKIAGMNPWQKVPESELPRTFGAKPPWQRAIVLGAGSLTHFVLAIVVLTVIFVLIGVPGDPTTTLATVQTKITPPPGFSVDPVAAESAPAKEAGFQAGDRVVAVDGMRIGNWEDLRKAIRSRPGQTISIEVERDGRGVELPVAPVAVTGKSPEGGLETVGLIGIVPRYTVERAAPHIGVWRAATATGSLIVNSVVVIGKVFSPSGIGRIFSSLSETGARGEEDPIGLVGGARLTGQAASAGRVQELLGTLTGFIVIIGVFNLLPLPPLDGGYLLILLIEKVRKRTVDLRRVVPVMAFVIGFLIFLQMALIYLDIVRPVTNPFQ